MAEAFAGLTLTAGERLDEAFRVWEGAHARARARGSVFGAQVAYSCRAAGQLKLGDLPGAERDARDAIALAETYGPIAQASILAVLAAALLGRGDLTGAEAVLAGIDTATVRRRIYDLRTHEVLAYARLARGRRAEAARLFLALGQLSTTWAATTPAWSRGKPARPSPSRRTIRARRSGWPAPRSPSRAPGERPVRSDARCGWPRWSARPTRATRRLGVRGGAPHVRRATGARRDPVRARRAQAAREAAHRGARASP